LLPPFTRAWLNFFTLTFRALGRNHIASTPLSGHRNAIQIPLVRTSSKLVINCTPDARKLPKPSIPRCWKAPAVRLVPTCSREIQLRPNSQSFSRSYGSILPTSLIYIVLSTRGCSPWRPAAVMSTTWLESYSFPRIFKGRRERTGPDKSVGLYQPLNPSSGQTDFRRTLPRAPAVVSAFSYVAVENPNPGAGILTGFPFEGRRTSAHFKTEFPYLLGSTNPCPTAFSFEYLLLPPRSALGAVLPSITAKASSLTPTPAYSPGHRFYPGGESFAPIPKFDDRFARQNRCEPPPEFPLASPYLGIVHHLSGPNSYALTQIHPKTSGSVDDAPLRVLTSVHFHYAYGFNTQILA
ncbi:hypothetical protein LSUE1_G006148, partial [Lachnellula suecica]